MRLGGEQIQRDSPFFSALSVSSFFSALGSEAIAQIASLCTSRKMLDGETLFLKGDPGDALYGVRRGQIVITTTTDTGRQFTLNILGAGDIFGEIALLTFRNSSSVGRRSRQGSSNCFASASASRASGWKRRPSCRSSPGWRDAC